jgi:multidrug efflux pump subunit AcrA (membrane-fusion protein)
MGEVVDVLEFTGRVTAVNEEDLFFRTDGFVRNIYFKRDDFVKEGDIIADLEIDSLERNLAAAQLQLERAQVRLDVATRDWEYDLAAAEKNLEIGQITLSQLRTGAPPDRDAIAVQERQVELAEIAVARLSHGVDPLLENDVAMAELEVKKLEADIADGQLIAPFDGQILSLALTPGQDVGGYRPVAVVADITNLEVSADLISTQLDGLEEGMDAELILSSRPGQPLSGTVRRLPFPYGSGPSGTEVEDKDTSTRVTIDQSPEEADYEEGDLIRVSIIRERKADVLWLPPQALRNFSGRLFVTLKDGDVERRVDVQVGIQTEDRVEIEEGLAEGQVVVGP